MKFCFCMALCAAVLLAAAGCAADPAVSSDSAPDADVVSPYEPSAVRDIIPPESVQIVNIAYASDVSRIGAAGFMQDAAAVTGKPYICDCFRIEDADAIMEKLHDGTLDMAFVPLNAVFDSTGTVCVAAASAKADICIIEAGNTVRDFGDLAGKTVFIPGSDPELSSIFHDVLGQYEFTEESSINVVTQKNETDCLASLLATPNAAAVLPMTVAASAVTENNGLRTALDLGGEWETAKDTAAVSTVLVASRSFAAKNADVLTDICRTLSVLPNADRTAAYLESEGVCGYDAAYPLLHSDVCRFIGGDEMRTRIENYMTVRGYRIIEDDAFYFGAASRNEE